MTTTRPQSPQRPPRLSPAAGCLLSLALGLAGVCLVTAVLALGSRGEIVLAKGVGNETRLWLVREADGAGLGWAVVRPLPSTDPQRVCERTSVSFLLWTSAGHRPAVSYCDCYQIADSGPVYEGPCSP